MIHITAHALLRAIERIPGITTEIEARAILGVAAVELAARFGAPFVKLGTGQRVVLVDNRVVTILPRETAVGCLSTERTSKHLHFKGA